MNAKTKNALIGGLLAIVFVMAIGYAAFAQQLTIDGTAEITSTWDVQMTSIAATSKTGAGIDVPFVADTVTDGTKLIDGATAQFKAELSAPGDSVTYTVTVKNSGDIDAKVNNIDFLQGANQGAMTYTYAGITTNDTLTAGESKTFTVTITYNNNVTGQPAEADLKNTVVMHVDYVQA